MSKTAYGMLNNSCRVRGTKKARSDVCQLFCVCGRCGNNYDDMVTLDGQGAVDVKRRRSVELVLRRGPD